MKQVMPPSFASLCLAIAMLAIAPCAASAQNEVPIAPQVPKRTDLAPIRGIKFTRTAEEAFQATVTPEAASWDEGQLILHWVRAGQWQKVGYYLDLYEAETARLIHGKIASELSYSNPKAVILPRDVLSLADASPVELDDRQVTHLGSLMRIAVRETESQTEIVEMLQKGTRRLGGTDEHRRKMAARILAAAELYEAAETFGLNENEARSAGQAAVAAEAANVHGWKETLAALRDKSLDAEARGELLDDVHELLLSSTPELIEKQLKPILADKDQQALAAQILGMIGEKTAAANREVDWAARTLHIELEHQLMELLGQTQGFDSQPWQSLANLAANNWLTEAKYSYLMYPSWQRSTTDASRDRNAHVSVEELIQHAPSDRWLKAVEPQLATFVRTSLARLILFSEDIDRVIPHVQALEKHDKPAAATLANAYLEQWAHRHDPNLSEELLKEYRLDSQVVVLTRSQQEASLKELSNLLSSLEPPTRQLLDETQLVRAFDFCHSRAEIYTSEHVTTVFGPLAEIPPSLIQMLMQKMRDKLAQQWRDLSIQRDAATRRTAADVFTLVNQGYTEATGMTNTWLKGHPDSWQMHCAAGSLYSDWGEFSYFQSVATEDNSDRFAAYLEHSQQGLEHFRAGAQGYATTVPKLSRTDFQLEPYRSWFYGLLGITHDGGINLRKGVTDKDLDELRQAMLALPGGAADVHLQLFSTMVADNIEANRIAPEMKYRYLSSAVRVTGSRATIYPAEEKVKYYDSLLEEVRLQTRLDGSDEIRSPGEFGVFVSLVHTKDVARESGGFEKYLMNEVQRTVSGRTIVEKPLYRDRFEEALRVALGNFFEVRKIAFADPAAGAFDIEAPSGAAKSQWQETPLAYVLLGTVDATVDRVPALEIELDFFDREGKVVIPVPSNPLQIEIKPDAPLARPVKNIEVTQVVDARELEDNRLKVDVIASAEGLVPQLEQLLDLENFPLPVVEVAERDPLRIDQLHSGPTGLYPKSERSWTLHLDPQPLLRGATERVEFTFPTALPEDVTMQYRRYEDMDPVEADAKVTLVEGEAEVAKVAKIDYRLWGAGGAGVLALALLAVMAVRTKNGDTTAPPPLFTLPAEFTPFSVIALLHRIQSSPAVTLSPEQRTQLAADMHALEQQAFARDSHAASSPELEKMARRWLDTGLRAARSQAA